MATVIEKTIGTGGDYASWSAWFAACPSDLVALGQIWRGRQLNQELTSASTLVTITGKTTNAECYVEMTAADGASFRDHPSKATNPLRYDATKGAAIKFTGSTGIGVVVQQAYTRVHGLQFSSTSTSATASGALYVSGSAAVTGCDFNECIVEGAGGGSISPLQVEKTGNVVRNTVVIQNHAGATTAHIAGILDGAKAYNCTFVSTNLKLNAGVRGLYAAGALENCYIGNVTAPTSGIAPTVTACATDATAAGYTTVPYSATTFESVTPGTMDLRTPVGSALRNAGTTNTTYSATDIYGTSRPQGAAYDIGAWEAPIVDTTGPVLTNPTGASTGTTTGSGSVTTNEAGGTLFYLTSINATETAATVKAGASKAVTATGVQNITPSGLTASTPYYNHFLHSDAANNDSLVASSGSFTTAAPGDTTAPILEVPAASATGSSTATGTVGTNEAGGQLYRFVSTSPTATAATVKAANLTSVVTATGTQTVSFTGLSQSTTYYPHYVQVDASGNESAVVSGSAFTTQAVTSSTGVFVTDAMTSSGTLRSNQSANYTWFAGGEIGVAVGVATHGAATLSAAATLTATGLPAGSGYILVKFADGGVAYQTGTVT